MRSRIVFIALLLCSLFGCRAAQEELAIAVAIVADGAETSYSLASDLTVDQLLDFAQIELGPRDRVSHPLVSPVVDGMRVTIRRVEEKEFCEQEVVAFQRRLLPKEGLPAGKQERGAAGLNGIREACYSVLLEDGAEVDRLRIGSPTIVRAPLDEIVYIGLSNEVQPVAIEGRLSYINHADAWTIVDNAANKRRMTAGHNLDALVFHQRQDGESLIFTSETDESDAFFNELWMIETSPGAEPIRMSPTDVLYAEWRPRANNEIAYSTGERRSRKAGWSALNNLWLMTIDLESGRALSIKEVLPESRGSWRGRRFQWAPQGDKLAWAQADGFGLVDFESKRLTPLSQYSVFHSAATWVWLSPLSWSYDGQLLAGIVHGAPIGDEPAEASPVFDMVVASADGRFLATISASAGMWAAPAFSPDLSSFRAEHSRGYLAWLQAREPRNSMSSGYDLLVADRDGSNRRRLFPPIGEAGIRKRDYVSIAQDLVWSHDGRFIALIYQGNLWLVDVESAESTQVTFDGQSSNPVWTN